MMFISASLVAIAAGAYVFSNSAKAGGQNQPEKLTASALRAMVVGLGYEVKDLNTEPGKEKYEFTVKLPDFNVPVGCEISPSQNYIWFTAFLGPAPKTGDVKYENMIKENGVVQPTFFYVTSKGNLMIAIAGENRYVNPTWMKRNIDKLAGDVSKTAKVWQ